MTALVCDLGGTNSRLGLVENQVLLPDTIASRPNDAFTDFPSLLRDYLDSVGWPDLASTCIALAAVPTAEGARLTNRDWDIRRDVVAAATGAGAVHFLNDFEALGLSLAEVNQLSTELLHPGVASVPGPRIVLGAGTGFNASACFRGPNGGMPFAAAAECGHMTLPVEGPEELLLQASLASGRGRASVERALSGNGLKEIYEWCCQRNGRPAQMRNPADISSAAVSRDDADCQQAADILIRLLGRVAGDLSLAFLATGGVYLAGGVTRAVAPLIRSTDTFLTAFRAKGRQSGFMESFPIALLLDDHAALSGCATWMKFHSTDARSARSS